MPSDVYRLTVNGGAKVAWGRMERCVIGALPLLAAGHTVHLRNLGQPQFVVSIYADGHLRIAKPTEHGSVCDLPDWGRQFLSIIQYSIGGHDEHGDDSVGGTD